MFGTRNIVTAVRKRQTDVTLHVVAGHLRQATALNDLLYVVTSDRDGFADLDFDTLREAVTSIRHELSAALAIVSNQQVRRESAVPASWALT